MNAADRLRNVVAEIDAAIEVFSVDATTCADWQIVLRDLDEARSLVEQARIVLAREEAA